MTDDERTLAELATRKAELTEELNEVRAKLRAAAKKVELPLIVVLNGNAVHVAKPAYGSQLPPCKIVRCVR